LVDASAGAAAVTAGAADAATGAGSDCAGAGAGALTVSSAMVDGVEASDDHKGTLLSDLLLAVDIQFSCSSAVPNIFVT
jgi:hypothetical protein